MSQYAGKQRSCAEFTCSPSQTTEKRICPGQLAGFAERCRQFDRHETEDRIFERDAVDLTNRELIGHRPKLTIFPISLVSNDDYQPGFRPIPDKPLSRSVPIWRRVDLLGSGPIDKSTVEYNFCICARRPLRLPWHRIHYTLLRCRR